MAWSACKIVFCSSSNSLTDCAELKSLALALPGLAALPLLPVIYFRRVSKEASWEFLFLSCSFLLLLARLRLSSFWRIMRDCWRRLKSPEAPHSAKIRSYMYFSRLERYLSSFLLKFLSSSRALSWSTAESQRKLHCEMISLSELMSLWIRSDGTEGRLLSGDCLRSSDWMVPGERLPWRPKYLTLGLWFKCLELWDLASPSGYLVPDRWSTKNRKIYRNLCKKIMFWS